MKDELNTIRDKYLSINDAASMVGYTYHGLYQAIKKYKIKTIKLMGKVYIERKSLVESIKRE